MTGVENSYEKELRGTQGLKYVIRDVWNSPKEVFKMENLIALQ